MAHDAPARLLTDVAVVLEACAEQLRRGTGTPPIDLDEALASVERDLHAAGAREDGAGEAVLYRELVLAVNRLAHGDSKALKIGAR